MHEHTAAGGPNSPAALQELLRAAARYADAYADCMSDTREDYLRSLSTADDTRKALCEFARAWDAAGRPGLDTHAEELALCEQDGGQP